MLPTLSLQKYVECPILGSGVNANPEAEDSSYDSDFENEESNFHQDANNSTTSDNKHANVSRTTSDTLAAEYVDYVNVQGTTCQTPGTIFEYNMCIS